MRAESTHPEDLNTLETALREMAFPQPGGTVNLPVTAEVRDILVTAICCQRAAAKILEKGDYEEVFRVTQWQPGRTLSEGDIQDIQTLLKQNEDSDETAVELFEGARQQILMELGGQKLVDAWNTRDKEKFDIAVQNAMAKYHKMRQTELEKRQAEAN